MAVPTHPPHAPLVGRTRRLLRRFHFTGIFWYRFHRWGVTVLPAWAVGPIIVLFTTFFFLTLRQIRRAIARNLEAVLGPCGWPRRQVRIYRTMWNFAWCLSERYEQLSTDRSLAVTLAGSEHWEAAASGGAGFIMVTAHLGNWEVGSLAAARRDERHVHVVREKELDPVAQEFIEELIQGQSEARYTTHFADQDVQLGVALLAALRAGEIVALQGDRPRTGGRTVEVRLFGRPILLPQGPAALARAAEVLLVPVFVFREGRLRCRAVVREPIRVARTPNRAADIAAAIQRVASAVEWAIREKPYQWFCFADLWAPGRKAPPQDSGSVRPSA